jgi:hypothetical protein
VKNFKLALSLLVAFTGIIQGMEIRPNLAFLARFRELGKDSGSFMPLADEFDKADLKTLSEATSNSVKFVNLDRQQGLDFTCFNLPLSLGPDDKKHMMQRDLYIGSDQQVVPLTLPVIRAGIRPHSTEWVVVPLMKDRKDLNEVIKTVYFARKSELSNSRR